MRHQNEVQASTNGTRGRRHRTAALIATTAIAALLVVTLLLTARWNGRQDQAGEASGSATGAMPGMAMARDSAVRLTTDQIRQFGITFGRVRDMVLETTVRTTGSVTFDESRLTQVTPRFSGYVERLYVDFTGQPVRKGQALFAIYSPELVAAQEELLLARRLQDQVGQISVPGIPADAVDLLASARRRLQLWDISDEQINRVLRTGEVQRTLLVRSPATGVVLEKNVMQGQALAAGQTAYTIANLREVWVEVALRESETGAIRVGSPAELDFIALPGRTIHGRIGYIYPTLLPDTRTVRARITVANPNGELKPGMYGTARIVTPGRRALAAPTSAIIHTGERAIVFVDAGQGRLEPREVRVGQVAGDVTEILAGLDAGQRVVTSAQFLLESESNLGEVMKRMLGQMGEADMGTMGGMEGMEAPGADMNGMVMPAPESGQ